ncbi:MAG TPA: hypothetical protein VL443_25415 [Cyclobacteriaceae bacterium]|nr:hypothetical protein [Cyclobacteriaceae bacterium]
MKKIFVSLALIICSVASVLAQVEKTVVVKEDEVPVAVRIAFKKDFNLVGEATNWKLTYSMTTKEGKNIATPLIYSYAKKEDGKKIVIQYTPEGKLTSFKGIEKAIDNTLASENKEKS